MSKHPRVAMFSTYAPSPFSGGSARLHWTRSVLEQAGSVVSTIVVNAHTDRAKVGGGDLHVTPHFDPEGAPDYMYEELHLGELSARDERLLTRVRMHLNEFRPDIVWLEQPFLFPVVEQLAASSSAKLVYSSQNVEYALKIELEALLGRPRTALLSSLIDAVLQVEKRALAASGLVFSICRPDQQRYLDEFNTDSVLLPNGTIVAESTYNSSSKFAALFGDPHHQFFAVAGSNYLPNTKGLELICQPSLAFLPPDARIAVAGSMSGSALDRMIDGDHRAVNSHRIAKFGFLGAQDFIQFSLAAPCAILPIFHGGGSNLKTADALAGGGAVIATRKALVGYEDVVSECSDAITVVDTPFEFRDAMRGVVNSARNGRQPTNRAQHLSWATRLSPAPKALSEL